jgi:hypothetical protein
MTTAAVSTPPRREPSVLVRVQLYVVVAYLAGAVLPYLWSPRAYPPTWTWIVPGWLLGVPGFYLTLLGAPFVGALAVVAVARLVMRRGEPVSSVRWRVAAAALTILLAMFMLTPLGRDIAVFVAD